MALSLIVESLRHSLMLLDQRMQPGGLRVTNFAVVALEVGIVQVIQMVP